MNRMANPSLHILFPVPSILKEQASSWDWALALVRMDSKMASLTFLCSLRRIFKTPLKTDEKNDVKQVFSFLVFLVFLKTNGELAQNVNIDTLSSIFDVMAVKCARIFISYWRVIVISILEYQIFKRFFFSLVRIERIESNIYDNNLTQFLNNPCRSLLVCIDPGSWITYIEVANVTILLFTPTFLTWYFGFSSQKYVKLLLAENWKKDECRRKRWKGKRICFI